MQLCRCALIPRAMIGQSPEWQAVFAVYENKPKVE
jgi:hypothetical protein